MNRETRAAPSFAEAFRFWLKLGFISFGGPTGQIAIMQAELVDKRRWISQSRFLHALNFCMLLPGPEAQQLAIYIGWLLHRTWGGIVAGALFVVPSIFILWALSYIYAAFGNVPAIAAVFYGLKPAVLAIVAVAVIRIGRKALRTYLLWLIALLAFVAIFFLHLSFPFIVLGAAAIGFVGGRLFPKQFAAQTDVDLAPAVLGDDASMPEHARPSIIRAVKLLVVWSALWFAPTIAVGLWRGWQSTLFHEGIFFSKAAVVTFGGAYAVLPYVAQQALFQYGWLRPGQMMDGLALAETTPGPLIMVLQFVGFIGAWQHPEGLSPLLAGTLGALITTWATFIPCFLWIFLGAPHIEQMRGNTKLNAALTAVTAAVVGVVLNLAVWFAINALFPAGHAVDGFAVLLCLAAFVAMLYFKIDIIPVVLAAGLLGLVYKLF